MSYKCEKELLDKLEEINSILMKQGIESKKNMVRDYMMKIDLMKGSSNLGKLVVYYSPKKNQYTYKKDNDMKEEVFSLIMEVIEGKEEIIINDIMDKQLYDDVDNNIYKMYVDGSYMNGKVGYGAVVIKDDNPVKEFYGEVIEDYAIKSRQVGGEIFAVVEGLKWCEEKGIKNISIYYDFQNLEKWATGEYKTNNALSQNYKGFIDSCNIDISWYKVKSHTGVEWNERADELAKQGIITSKDDKVKDEVNNYVNNDNDKLRKDIEEYFNKIITILGNKGYNIEFDRVYDSEKGKIEIYWDREI